MDDFFGVVLVIIAIISAISKNANKTKKAQAQSRQILTAVPKTKAVPQETKAMPMETKKAAPMAEETMLPPEMPAEPAARQEIAPRVGLQSGAQLGTAFRRAFGVTPGAYRRTEGLPQKP